MDIRIEEIAPQLVLGIRTHVSKAEIGQKIGELMSELGPVASDICVGPPLARYHTWDGDAGEMEVAVPVRESREATGRVAPCELPGGQAVVARYIGPYEGLPAAWQEVVRWMEAESVTGVTAPWEHYVSDPSETPPEQLETRIVWPIES